MIGARAETWLERFPAGELGRRLDELKEARRQGWDITVLVTQDSRSVVVLGYRVPFASSSATPTAA